MPRRDIHSLPTETISHIIRTAVVPPLLSPRPLTATDELQGEIERIANAPLLTLSRVCSRWHEIVMNTTTFWSTVDVRLIVDDTPSRQEITIWLLKARLERSRDAPLSHFGPINSFASAPRLESLSLPASLSVADSRFLSGILGRNKLQRLKCTLLFPSDFENASSFIPNLPAADDFELLVVLDSRIFIQHYISLELIRIPPITGSISNLRLWLPTENQPHEISTILGHVFESLALPELRRLNLWYFDHRKLALEWPHTQFLALCGRSNLGRCLKALDILEVRIAEGDLLETLSFLAALEELAVGDAIITDSFLQTMTCALGQEELLVPCLSRFACVSRMMFSHGYLVDFASSRIARQSSSSFSFHLCIDPFPGTDTVLALRVRTMLRELAASNKKFVAEVGVARLV